eukprot:Skav204636  [mRNA]  locus=scaffold1712:389094:392411:- [translate_table: standard]
MWLKGHRGSVRDVGVTLTWHRPGSSVASQSHRAQAKRDFRKTMKVLSFSLAAAGLFWQLAQGDTADAGSHFDACDDCEDGFGLSLLQLQAAQLTETNASTEQVPMVAYPKKYCQHCGEMAFCHRASNPGCGGRAMGGVASFNNHVRAKGCKGNPTLTVPRSYMRDIRSLAHYAGGRSLLRQMLISGFYHQKRNGDSGPVWQCIHAPKHVSVPAISTTPHQLHLRGTPGGRQRVEREASPNDLVLRPIRWQLWCAESMDHRRFMLSIAGLLRRARRTGPMWASEMAWVGGLGGVETAMVPCCQSHLGVVVYDYGYGD